MNEAENAATFDELFDLAAGDLPAERAAELANLAEADRELAAKIVFVRQLNPPDTQWDNEHDTKVAIPVDIAAMPKRRFPILRNRRLVAAMLLALLAVSGVSITWAVLHEPPLFSDDFDDNWPDPGFWRFPRPRVREQDGQLWLQNRGCVVTQKEFSGPVAISFRWRWIDLAENPAYAEILSVAFRTSGEMRKEYTYEIEDGLVITIDTQEGGAYLSYATKGIKPRQRLIPSSGAEGRIPLPAHEWHDVRIVDDGSTVTLYLRGPATGIGETYWTKPLLQSRVEQTFAGKRIAIYNREVVGGAPHLSQIDDFVVHRVSAEPKSNNEKR